MINSCFMIRGFTPTRDILTSNQWKDTQYDARNYTSRFLYEREITSYTKQRLHAMIFTKKIQDPLLNEEELLSSRELKYILLSLLCPAYGPYQLDKQLLFMCLFISRLVGSLPFLHMSIALPFLLSYSRISIRWVKGIYSSLLSANWSLVA